MSLRVEVLVNIPNSLTVESTVTIPNSLKVESTVTIPQVLGGEPYNGSYDVTPKIYEQKLATKNKTMHDNVTVKSIPYYETSNLSNGRTVIIGGELNE